MYATQPLKHSVIYTHVLSQTIVRGPWQARRDNEHPVCLPGSQLFHNFCSVVEIIELKPSEEAFSLCANANGIQE